MGPKTVIMPGVEIKNTFIKAGTLVSKSTKENSIIYGNPQKEKGVLNKKLCSRVNRQNYKFHF